MDYSAILLAIRFAAALTGSLARWAYCAVVLGVVEQLADHRKPFADEQSAPGKAMAEVMNSYIVEPGPSPDTPPGMLQVGEMAVGLVPGDHPRIVLPPVNAAQHGDGRIAQMHSLGSRLGVGQSQFARIQVDMLPAEFLDLEEPAPRQSRD